MHLLPTSPALDLYSLQSLDTVTATSFHHHQITFFINGLVLFATTIHATSPLIGRRQYVYFFTRQPRFHYHATQDTIAMATQLQATPVQPVHATNHLFPYCAT